MFYQSPWGGNGRFRTNFRSTVEARGSKPRFPKRHLRDFLCLSNEARAGRRRYNFVWDLAAHFPEIPARGTCPICFALLFAYAMFLCPRAIPAPPGRGVWRLVRARTDPIPQASVYATSCATARVSESCARHVRSTALGIRGRTEGGGGPPPSRRWPVLALGGKWPISDQLLVNRRSSRQ